MTERQKKSFEAMLREAISPGTDPSSLSPEILAKLNELQAEIDRIKSEVDGRQSGEAQIETLSAHNASSEQSDSRKVDQGSPLQLSEHSQPCLDRITGTVLLPPGRYCRNKDIIIEPGGSLLMQEDTSLLFSEQTGLYAYGVLVARGGLGKSIVFEAQDRSWKNISFMGPATQGSVLEDIVIRSGSGIPSDQLSSGCSRGNAAADLKRFQGMLGGGIAVANASPLIRNCVIQNCDAGEGGGIFTYASAAEIINNTIESNRAHLGGGLYVFKSDAIVVKGNTLQSNQADVGAGVYYDTTHIRTCIENIIQGNIAKTAGGGLCLWDGYGVIRNNSFYDNEAATGGALYLLPNVTVLVEENTIANNRAKTGGAIFFNYSNMPPHHDPVIKGNAVYDNTPDDVRYGGNKK
jgi:hypothetical protein